MNNNFKICKTILQTLLSLDVRELCICSGKRNLPLAMSLKALKKIKIYTHFEERAAAFFCLGRIKQTKRPVVILTSSGTAVGELLPAMMEAYYSGLPLIAITADRPKHYRGTGAPQSCYQNEIFKNYGSLFFDLDKDDFSLKKVNSWNRLSPIHINACFEEPLSKEAPLSLKEIKTRALLSPSSQKIKDKDIRKFLSFLMTKNAKLFFIVGKLSKEDSKFVKEFFSITKFPGYFEAPSYLRQEKIIQEQSIDCVASFFQKDRPSHVIRIGHVPTHKIWRELEGMNGKLKVFSVNSLHFKGLSYGEMICGDIGLIFRALNNKIKEKTFLKKSYSAYIKREEIHNIMKSYPKAEQSLIHKLSLSIPKKANIYLGNSSPIRYFDAFSSYEDKGFTFENSRGINGIDGQISTFLGWSKDKKADRESWGIFGDLTALYDLSSPWVIEWMTKVSLRIVIINNFGGQIFSGFKHAELMTNPHRLSFKHWAKHWGLAYKAYKTLNKDCFKTLKKIPYVIEILPSEEETHLFGKKFNLVLNDV